MADRDRQDPWSAARANIAAVYGIDLDAVQADKSALATTVAATARPSETSRRESSVVKRLGTADLIPPLENSESAYTTSSDPRRIEQNFDDMLKLVEACRSFRREYSSDASAYLDTRLKLEEFFRLDAIHQLEVEAGAYEVQWRDSLGELTSTSERLKGARDLDLALDSVFEDGGALAQPQIDAFVASNGEAARQASNREQAREPTVAVATYRSGLELKQWQRARVSGKADVASLASLEASLKAKEAYLAKDVSFRQWRATVARDISYVKLGHHISAGGPLNFAERLAATKTLFNRYLVQAVDRALAVQEGARSVYGISIDPLVLKDNHVLDELSEWGQIVQERLARRRRQERVAIVGVSVANRIERFRSRLESGASIEIRDADLLGVRSALLRGVSMDIVVAGSVTPIAFSVSPPGLRDALKFGRVVAATDTPTAQYAESIWNRPALGQWSIRCSGKLPAEVVDVVLNVWVAYQAD